MKSMFYHCKSKTIFLLMQKKTKKWDLLQNYYDKYLTDFRISPSMLSSYNCIATVLLDCIKPTTFVIKSQEQLFDRIFLSGIHHEAFMILVRKLDGSCESYQQQKILDLLQKFLHGGSITSMLLCQCISSGVSDPEYIATSLAWKDLVTFLVSLPERVANKTKGKMHKIFQASCYVPLLISSLLKVLTTLHQKITDNQNCTVEFLGKLIGKMSVLGYGDKIAKHLYIEIIKFSEKDFIWRKLSQNLITKVPSASLESFITNLLLIIPWFGYLDWIMGDETERNSKLKFIMSSKLILVRHFKEVLILQNIIGYFATAQSRRTSFWNIFSSLVQVWSDESVTKFQNFEQQKYIASALIICSGWIKHVPDSHKGTVFVDKVLTGATIRIKNSEANVRSLGLVVGDCVLSSLDPEAVKLDYKELNDENLVADMKSLLEIPMKPEIQTDSAAFFHELESMEQEKKNELQAPEQPLNSKEQMLIDSDDELEPYDTSNDQTDFRIKRPFYLRDCLNGLIEQENRDWFEQCLKHAESLIQANADTVHEVAAEMAKVLLHLDNQYAIPDFDRLRHEVLVSLTVHSPVLVADYLTSQFYENEYNIRQRLDILEVIAVSSQLLSRPTASARRTEEAPRAVNKDETNAGTEKIWQTIVNERIAAKTRYLSKTKRNIPSELTENRFNLVAGYFFFPLLAKYDKKIVTMKLFEVDSYLLGRLTYTLGVVMHSASNLPISQELGKALLQYLKDTHNHPDKFVRLASIFASATVFAGVPGYLLIEEDLMPLVIETRDWLQSIVDNDPETECQIKATYSLSLVMNAFKNACSM